MNALLWGILALVILALAIVVGALLLFIRHGKVAATGPPEDVVPQRGRTAEKEETAILERMSEGVLVLDRRMRPRFANASARRLLGLQPGASPEALTSVEVTDVARRALDAKEPQTRLVDVWFPDRLTLRVQAVPMKEDSAILVVLNDASEEIRAQRIRTQFVANASHELKSPVASLQALAEAVGQAVGEDPDTAVRFSARLVEEADRLGKLVSDLLDLSRLEDAGRVPDEPCDLSEIAGSETSHLESTARGDIIALTSDIEPSLWVKGDAHQLGQMIRNLLENAIQYTPAGGNVSIALKRRGETASLQVSDSGVGIPGQAQERVFERFYRVDVARAREHGGTGLGLAIAKHVAELHGGSIGLDSEVGRGSTFEVTLPLLDEASGDVGDRSHKRPLRSDRGA